MPENRANLTQARGLVTFGSELTKPQGSQKKADNVNIDEDGVITPRRGFNNYLNPTAGIETTSNSVSQIMEYKDAIIRKYQNSIEYEDVSTGEFKEINGTYNSLREGYRTKWKEANSNLYFTSDEGIKKMSVNNSSSLNPDMVTNSGGVKAGYLEGKTVPFIGGFLPPQSKVAYRYLFGKKDESGNLIYGAPSSRAVLTNFDEETVTYRSTSISFTTVFPETEYDNTTTYNSNNNDVVRFNKLNYDADNGGTPFSGEEPSGDESDNGFWTFKNAPNEINNGDYFVIYVGSSKYTVYYDVDGDINSVPPTSGDTIGSTYIKVSVIGFQSDNSRITSSTANTIATSISDIDVSVTSGNVLLITGNDTVGQVSLSDPLSFFNSSIQDRIKITPVIQGSTVTGVDARVTLTGVVPKNLGEGYFYQVFRTATITASEELPLEDTDPGDEMNLIYESPIKKNEIDSGQFEFTDSTPESFRKEAISLYTNQISGEGILQANEAPPIALDIELFRNHMFYANTKGKHKLEFTVISIDDFKTSSTKIIIGNSDVTRYYTFVGTSHVQDIQLDSVPTAGDYIKLSSANNDRQYYIYFGSSSDDPNIDGSVGYNVGVSDLELYPTYDGDIIYNPGDKVSFNSLNYICNNVTTGESVGAEEPSGNTTDNGFWDYSDPVEIVASRIAKVFSDIGDFNVSIFDKYKGTTEYNTGDTVLFDSKNYLCIKKTTGTDNILEIPTETTYWTYISEANVVIVNYANNGYTTGIESPIFEAYSPTETYINGDYVSDGVYNFKCIESTTTGNPPDNTLPIEDNAQWAYIADSITILPASTSGTGELAGTDSGGNVLLSGLISVGQSIDETARSLVKIISQDPDSPVNAYYLSTGEDLPGNILLEAKSLEDKTFYIAVEEDNNPSIGEEFNPELPVSKKATLIESNATSIIITKVNHGYDETSNQVFVSLKELTYDDTLPYTETDRVSYNNNIYECILDITASEPSGDDTDNTYWAYLCPQLSDLYTVTKITDDTFSIPVVVPNIISFVPTLSATFTIDVESDNTEIVNRVYYSKRNEPEAVPTENFIDIGSRNSEIKRILALRDNLFVLKDDGIYVISGTSSPNWSSRLLDNTRITAPDSAVILNNQIYCLTEQGITRITGSGAAIISRGIEDQIDSITNRGFDFSSNTFGVSYQNDRCYILFVPEDSSDDYSVKAFRYNIFEKTWSTWTYDATCGHVLKRDNTLYLGRGIINYITKERKNFDRTDFCDENFTTAISSDGLLEDKIDITSLLNIEKYDTLVQKQDVTIGYYNNRLLKKMDLLDNKIGLSGFITSSTSTEFNTEYPHNLKQGSTWRIILDTDQNNRYDNDYTVTVTDNYNFTINFDSTSENITKAVFKDYYYTTFKAKAGDNMADKMEELNYHIYLVDFHADTQAIKNMTNRGFSLSNLKTETEAFIADLNDPDTITAVKNYKLPETTYFETHITETDTYRSQVTVHTPRPFVEGDIEVYKGFECEVEWNPQHFGDPSALKQIRYVTIMFDQNNFYSAIARFSTDIGQSFVEVPFSSKGISYFGDQVFDDPNAYWGGLGNDVPYRAAVPTSKQRCRYISLGFQHNISRESFRILGVSAVVRAVSDRGYK